MTVQTTTAIGRAVLILREGEELKAYYDTQHVLTIGVGHTSAAGEPVTVGETITLDHADSMFAKDLVKYEKTVIDAVKVTMADNEFDALVSLCYNIGQGGFAGSTVVKRLNAGDRKGAADAFSMWEKNKELIDRREAEKLQFQIPYSVAMPRPRKDEAPIKAPAGVTITKPVSVAPKPAAAPVSPTLAPAPVQVALPAKPGFWGRIKSLFGSKA